MGGRGGKSEREQDGRWRRAGRDDDDRSRGGERVFTAETMVAGGVRRRRVRRTRQSTIEEGGVRGWSICRCEEERISSTVPDSKEEEVEEVEEE